MDDYFFCLGQGIEIKLRTLDEREGDIRHGQVHIEAPLLVHQVTEQRIQGCQEQPDPLMRTGVCFGLFTPRIRVVKNQA
ncbi:hypothetical protein [Robertkochia flava]|uniref:hypothetical protein n=1 Tax=Robertkochia flava TaxID=3447986 RepID=UPI001CCA99EE|nr:hypothetical protein [Robertkochia marina]